MGARSLQALFAVLTTASLWGSSALLSAAPPPVKPPEPALDPASPAGARLTLTTERVVVFKDGHGLFAKRGVATAADDGTVYTDAVPEAAVLGTFWAAAEGRELESMSAGWFEAAGARVEESSCVTTLELLRANPGRRVTLGLGGRQVKGKLVGVLEEPLQKRRPAELLEGAGAGEATRVEREQPPRGGELVVLDGTDEGRLVLPVAAVTSVSGEELGTHCRRTRELATRTRRLTFHLGKAAAGKEVALRLFYFTPGVRWIPSYRVETGKGARAEVWLQGEVLNDEEDIVDATLELVVGVPAFRFKDSVSPLSLEQTLRAALGRAEGAVVGPGMLTNARFDQRSIAAPTADAASLLPAMVGDRQQDLFRYPVKHFTLARGARAAVPLWKRAVGQRHVYTADLVFARGVLARAQGNDAARSPLRLAENPVWHQLELFNHTDSPWTTGAALLLEGGFPLGQDVLAYTAPGARTLVPMMRGLDLQVRQFEVELERQEEGGRVGGAQLSLVKKKGTIMLLSRRSEPSTMRVSLATGGKVTKAEGAEVKVDDGQYADFGTYDLALANQHSDVAWEVTLGAGQKMTLSYELSVYEYR